MAKAFKITSFDLKDDPKKIYNNINKYLFKKPMLINIHTNRIFWHAGAGKDKEKIFDVPSTKEIIRKEAKLLIKKLEKIKLLWEKS